MQKLLSQSQQYKTNLFLDLLESDEDNLVHAFGGGETDLRTFSTLNTYNRDPISFQEIFYI